MGNRTRLLATVALPIASLIWQPADAAAFRAMQPVEATQGVILVQSDEGGSSEEELRKKRRQQREENQQGGEERQERRKNSERSEQGGNRDNGGEGQSDRQRQREERSKQREERGSKQREQNADEENRSDEQRQSESQRKKERAQQAEEQKQRSDDKRQSDRQRQREERNKERQQKAEEQNRSDEQRQSESQRKKERAEKAEEQKRAEEKRQSDSQRQSERNKERENRADEQKAREQDSREQKAGEQKRSDDKADRQRAEDDNRRQDDRQRAREERRKKAEADRERRADDEGRQRPRRERDENRERIARDPSRTTDTIDLPVVGGAAVLDSDKDADNRREGSREERRKRRDEERRNSRVRDVPKSDAEAQVDRDGKRRQYDRYETIDRERGERRDRRPDWRDPDNVRIGRREDNRVIYNVDNRTFVRHYDGDRLSRRAGNTYYENLRGGRVRETVERPGGVRVVTIRDSYGEVIQRSRFVGDREYVLYYVPEVDYAQDRRPFYDPGQDLPPMRLSVPVDEYIIDTSSDYDRDYQEFLELPPVEPVERVYTLDEVKYSARIRDKVRRIDLDTITFSTGSAEISMEQASTLRQVADAINNLLDADPSETFLIEGHTDAVGSDDSNLILSDERAESVANLLTDVYDIPPENLSTQGYGERYLKVATDGPEQLNRRVTIRRVTPLVKPVASAQ